MPVQKLKQFLDQNHVKYVTIGHSRAFTAQQIASIAHVPGQELAKTVMVKVDGKMAMAVLPANFQIDFPSLRSAIGRENVVLATESEFAGLFPGCEIGAMPPFGNLYGMEVYVAKTLTEDKEICFNAGTHTELIRMSYADFEKLVQPKELQFSAPIAML